MGGTQLTGLHLVPRLLAEGHKVTLLSRGQKRPAFLAQVEHVRADRFSQGLAALAGRRFDATIDNIAYEPAHVRQVAEALGIGAGHYIFNSTAFVAEPVGEWLAPITDEAVDAVVASAAVSGAGDLAAESCTRYVVDKQACELLLQSGSLPFPWTILRPVSVYGEVDPPQQQRLSWWVARVLDGHPILIPDDFPELNGARNNLAVYAGDVAAAQIACLGNAAAYGRSYQLAQDEAPSIPELVACIARAADKQPPELVSIPRHVVQATPLAANPAGAYRVSMLWPGIRVLAERAKEELGWQPTPLDTWLGKVVPALAAPHAHGEPWSERTGYAQRALEVKVARRWQEALAAAAVALQEACSREG
ncbi:MAG: NAD-dependent epimerase/dehydratase family protein [Symbiobacteriia bacterium]